MKSFLFDEFFNEFFGEIFFDEFFDEFVDVLINFLNLDDAPDNSNYQISWQLKPNLLSVFIKVDRT